MECTWENEEYGGLFHTVTDSRTEVEKICSGPSDKPGNQDC